MMLDDEVRQQCQMLKFLQVMALLNGTAQQFVSLYLSEGAKSTLLMHVALLAKSFIIKQGKYKLFPNSATVDLHFTPANPINGSKFGK